MKINNDAVLGNIISSKYDSAVSDMSKSLMQMKAGDTFNGTIQDIKQNSITLKLDDNSVINAKSLATPDLRIGERADFTVKENNSGQIFVEISKTEESTKNFIKELLGNAELPATKENIEFVKSLIDNNMPIDKKTISDGLFFKYSNELTENMSSTKFSESNQVLEKVLFLLKENMPADKVTVDTLNRLLDTQTNIKSEILNIAKELPKLADGELKSKLLEILNVDKTEFSNPKELQKIINEKLFFNENDLKSQESLNSKFEEIFEVATKSGKVLSEISNDAQANNIKESFNNIKNDLNFMKEIDNYKDYIQIPININGKENECELHIFKNSKNKNDYSKRASVLLSLDYFFIGKIDAFIEKTDQNLAFQFKCEKVDTISLIKKNINSLSNLLGNYGFKITNVSYKEKDENFNVLKNKNDEQTEKKKATSNRRYSFDMRV